VRYQEYQGGNVEGFKKVKSNSKWGVIPYRTNSSGKIEVLVISTKRKNWSLPKGNLMKRIGPARTAQLEAYEEAGIEGALASKPYSLLYWTDLYLFIPHGREQSF
jgi:8-oxo-dGTP pyrophosphatase MutT (NUDIX family)